MLVKHFTWCTFPSPGDKHWQTLRHSSVKQKFTSSLSLSLFLSFSLLHSLPKSRMQLFSFNRSTYTSMATSVFHCKSSSPKFTQSNHILAQGNQWIQGKKKKLSKGPLMNLDPCTSYYPSGISLAYISSWQESLTSPNLVNCIIILRRYAQIIIATHRRWINYYTWIWLIFCFQFVSLSLSLSFYLIVVWFRDK